MMQMISALLINRKYIMAKESTVDFSTYKLILTGQGVTVERDISESVARRVMTIALGGGVISGGDTDQGESVAEISPISDGATPKAFMATKRPISDVERITCLAYYLAHYKNIGQFKTVELTILNTQAAQPRFSNPTVAARNAVQKEFLSLAGGAKKQITARGEALVEALPNRDKVKSALEEAPARKRRSTRSAKKVLPKS